MDHFLQTSPDWRLESAVIPNLMSTFSSIWLLEAHVQSVRGNMTILVKPLESERSIEAWMESVYPQVDYPKFITFYSH